jgi:hypothetical protein
MAPLIPRLHLFEIADQSWCVKLSIYKSDIYEYISLIFMTCGWRRGAVPSQIPASAYPHSCIHGRAAPHIHPISAEYVVPRKNQDGVVPKIDL